jgi:hypothetical protein
MSNKHLNIYFSLALLLLFLGGLFARLHVFEAQIAPGWDEVPFTMESALHYRLVRQIFESGQVPELDRSIQHPEGLRPSEAYSVSDEYLLAAALKLLPEGVSMTAALRFVSAAWFCIGIPLLGLWAAAMSRSRMAGLLAAAFYAFMIASVIRSTGQELSRENFALPLLIGHLLLNTSALQSSSRSRKSAFGLLSGALLGTALVVWDLIQFYIFLFYLYEGLRYLFGRAYRAAGPEFRVAPTIVATIALAMLSPYHRSHGLLFSPLTMLGIGLLLAYAFESRIVSGPMAVSLSPGWKRALLLLAMLAPLALALLLAGDYSANYGHFGGLLLAKLRHFNIKPADPAQLGFDARIMWVPALNSANSRIVFSLFPYTLLLTLALYLICLRTSLKFKLRDESIPYLLLLLTVSFVSFLLFVRFHVFLALFISVFIGYAVANISRASFWKACTLWTIAVLVLVGETGHALREPERWGRPMVYYQQMAELMDWLEENIPGEPLVANFGISASILAYAGNPIVLHPKFESSQIRELVREYGELMFKADELRLRDWMDARQARYLLYSLGEFSNVKPEWQMRYFVDALEPALEVPARLFEYEPDALKYFKYEWGNTKYRVFRMISVDDEVRARSLLAAARAALENGRVAEANDLASRALALDPNQSAAVPIVQQSGSLLDQGFGE